MPVKPIRKPRPRAAKPAAGYSVVPVQTFAPEPFEVAKPFQVLVRMDGEEFEAAFPDAGLTAYGDSLAESVANLKALMVDALASLSARPAGKLGPAMVKRLAVLGDFIRRK